MASRGSRLDHPQWIDALKIHPLFGHLTEDSCSQSEGDFPVCQSRCDLFVWDPVCQLILTTNLKRLHASTILKGADNEEEEMKEELFQYLHPTIFPATPPVSLTPSPIGRHLALIGSQYVYIIELWRQRGPQGEFSGGVSEVDCRTISVGDVLMRAHRLSILQVKWRDDDDNTIGVLTNDGALRLYRLADPSVPSVTMLVSVPRPEYSRVLSLDQQTDIIAFNFMSSNNNIILLQSCMDVQTIRIYNGEQPIPPLPMYPIDKDNYSDTASGLLLILSCPPVVVMATTTGRLLHSIYMEPEESDNEESETIGGGSVTVIENIQLGFNETNIKLLSDCSIKYCYCVVTSADIYSIELPWLKHLDQFGYDGIQFCANPPAIVNHLLHSSNNSISDCTLVVDNILGINVIAVINDGSCVTVPLEFLTTSLGDNTNYCRVEPDVEIPPCSPFVSHIGDLLVSPKGKTSFPKRLMGSNNDAKSQEEIFQFLQESLIMLRQHYVATQQIASAKLNGRIQLLLKRKERQMNDILKLEEVCDDISEIGSDLERKTNLQQHACQEKIERLEKLLAEISCSSPLISDAERILAKDLILIKEHLKGLNMALEKAKSKVSLNLQTQSLRTKLSLNETKLGIILTSITDDGTAIKNSIKIIKDLGVNLEVDVTK